MKKKILNLNSTAEERKDDAKLRPANFSEYVGQENYYRVDSGYKYSYRNYGTEEDYQNVYTFSNLKGTFYFNTGTASGQKYYAPMREIGNHKSIENDVKKRSDTEVQDDKKRHYEGIS